MRTFRPDYSYLIDPNDGIQVKCPTDTIQQFTPEQMNIGNLKTPTRTIEVIAVIFDLEGFTHFTRQIDPQLTIPDYITDFYNWLFRNLRQNIIVDGKPGKLWAEMPFYSKFLGDGVLFLWRIDHWKISKAAKGKDKELLHEHLQTFICNIVSTLDDICRDYSQFYQKALHRYTDPPTRLRCGIARGNVFPIGGGNDYIGPCINLASRLQKFHGLSFAFSHRGIDSKRFHKTYRDYFEVRQADIRGIGNNELIGIRKEEFEKLSEEEKAFLRKV